MEIAGYNDDMTKRIIVKIKPNNKTKTITISISINEDDSINLHLNKEMTDLIIKSINDADKVLNR